MKRSKIIIAAVALTLGFAGTALSATSAYSHSETLSTGNKVEASFIKSSASPGQFRARLEARDTVNFMSVDLSRYEDGGFNTLAHDGGHKKEVVSVRANASESDDLLAIYFVNDSGTKWSHSVEYNNGSFEES